MSDMPTDEEIVRAVRLGRVAGRAGRPLLDVCPYDRGQRVLRYRFAMGYAEGKAAAAPPDWVARVKAWLTRVWYGDGED